MKAMCQDEFNLDDLDFLQDGEDYIHEDSCIVDIERSRHGHTLVMTPLLSFKDFDEDEELDLNNHGYCSLLINTLLHPQGIPRQELRGLYRFVKNLVFIANPQLVAKEYIEKILESRHKERLDELCELLVIGIEQKVEYHISQEENPLF